MGKLAVADVAEVVGAEVADTLSVIKAGPQMLIQDLGRRGCQHLGISVGGVADSHAAGWANRLLDNPANAALLEICLGGVALRFLRAARFALTGADLNWQLDGRALGNWQSYSAAAGAVLSGGLAVQGVRAYMALAGGIAVAPICGSLATTVAEGIGGIHGQALQSGDQLPAPVAPATAFMTRRTPAMFCRDYPAELLLRVVPSNQHHLFGEHQLCAFFSQEYRVSPASDRMGVRLQGTALASPPQGLISEPVAAGAIQVPANGLPIVLMPDCQTIGGYPKIGHVYRVDLDRLAQARPGQRVRFLRGSRAEAQAEWLLQRRFFHGGA
ncbi:5-oxoprolinase subunit C family protein [Microbulbifer pacificus]|uniref:Biotin-dependent carboxyltransferase family protein n=1 Tax=Microbulbifer pacificus TaxID=407164 RepID=A0AAU0MX06_9GAMM|nr:biotin-dependent carboxyltransferase family protein [Microbulbifer pacificus]WOX04726.1 biotin-dependent carboxyltransferase family protein [Microbulbifer pacificus]